MLIYLSSGKCYTYITVSCVALKHVEQYIIKQVSSSWSTFIQISVHSLFPCKQI